MNSKISNKKDIIYSVCLAVIVFAVFSISIHYQFLESFDDNGHVLHNRYLTFSFTSITYWLTHACVGCYMPLTMLSYIFDYSLWGLNSFGFHLQNIFWHIVATIAIYSCFRLFKIKSWIAFFLCLIFAVHPQRVESVVWISERKDVLCAAFYFLSIFFYIKNNNKKFNITAFILFILAILSKPMAISLPVVLVLYEFYIYGKSRGQRAERTEIRGQRAEVGDQITAKKNTNPDRRDTRRMSETCNVQATVIRYAPRTSIKSTKIIRLICLIR